MKMGNLIPCWTDSEELNRLPPDNMDLARAIEAYTDEMLADCRVFHNAESIVIGDDLDETNLLPDMMVAVANWDGSSESAAVQIRVLHNLLADALQRVAEGELA